MLIGELKAKLGEKNRTAIPSNFRNELKKDLIITKGYEGCLLIVDEDRWTKLIKIIEVRPLTNQDVRNTKRFLIGGANEISFDNQGRFVIPENLVSYAKLGPDLVFVGLIDWIELWDHKIWQSKIEEISNSSADIAERLSKININA